MNLMFAITTIEENPDATHEDRVKAYQYLIDTAIIWSLQGSHQRIAMALVEAGECTVPDRAKR